MKKGAGLALEKEAQMTVEIGGQEESNAVTFILSAIIRPCSLKVCSPIKST